MRSLAAAIALTLCSCSTMGEWGAILFAGERKAAGLEIPLGRVKLGLAVTLARATVSPDADEGERPWGTK